ncbi:MAG: L,D-transpeptidase [Pseudonocardiaceae bacterium]
MARWSMLRTAVGCRNADRVTAGRVLSRSTPVALISGVLGVLLVAGCAVGDAAAQGIAVPSPPPPVTLAQITSDPANHEVAVSPLEPITVTVAEGTFEQVTLTNGEGDSIPGQLSPDGLTWRTTQPLGYRQTYTITASANGADNHRVTQISKFTTIVPRTVTFPSVNPLDGQTVGVGQPLAIYFDEPISDKKAAQDAITVTTAPQVEGAFYWYSDKEVHWRPQEFWEPGTQVTADIKVYGKNLGNGVYGEEDRTIKFTIGDSVIARADGATHQMTVEINGQTVRTMPISMGSPRFPSNNGIHVVTDRHANKVMDSTTFGLQLTEGGYVTEVKWATRISNGGEFVHSAPWSVRQQGHSNVSHGCINLSPENAKWFYDTVKKGDIVINTNTGGSDLRVWDGFGDWQVPWAQWLTGGAN